MSPIDPLPEREETSDWLRDQKHIRIHALKFLVVMLEIAIDLAANVDTTWLVGSDSFGLKLREAEILLNRQLAQELQRKAADQESNLRTSGPL